MLSMLPKGRCHVLHICHIIKFVGYAAQNGIPMPTLKGPGLAWPGLVWMWIVWGKIESLIFICFAGFAAAHFFSAAVHTHTHRETETGKQTRRQAAKRRQKKTSHMCVYVCVCMSLAKLDPRRYLHFIKR